MCIAGFRCQHQQTLCYLCEFKRTFELFIALTISSTVARNYMFKTCAHSVYESRPFWVGPCLHNNQARNFFTLHMYWTEGEINKPTFPLEWCYRQVRFNRYRRVDKWYCKVARIFSSRFLSWQRSFNRLLQSANESCIFELFNFKNHV